MKHRGRKIHKGRWELQRERNHIADTEPSAPYTKARSLGEVLPGVMKKLGLERQHWFSELTDSWPDIAGANVAAHARPGRVEGNMLIVFVDNSVWLSELARYGKDRLLKNVHKRFGRGNIASVVFRLDPDLEL